MKINYRIVSYNTDDHSMTVRYWTDIVTEKSLATFRDNENNPVMTANGYPERCQTDVNISFFTNKRPSEEDIMFLIKRNIPLYWLKTKEDIMLKDPDYDLEVLKTKVGKQDNIDVDI